MNEADKEKVYALSNPREPLDSWAMVCGWNFAKRNVKGELTQHPTKAAAPCKQWFKLHEGRDGVKGAREWGPNMEL